MNPVMKIAIVAFVLAASAAWIAYGWIATSAARRTGQVTRTTSSVAADRPAARPDVASRPAPSASATDVIDTAASAEPPVVTASTLPFPSAPPVSMLSAPRADSTDVVIANDEATPSPTRVREQVEAPASADTLSTSADAGLPAQADDVRIGPTGIVEMLRAPATGTSSSSSAMPPNRPRVAVTSGQ
jgi:hypothetical protein